jgi:L-asparagine transporter-like permease
MFAEITAWVLIAVWAAIAVYDIYLMRHPEKTSITSRYRPLLPRWLDYIILIALGYVIFKAFGVASLNFYIFGVVMGHLGWNE